MKPIISEIERVRPDAAEMAMAVPVAAAASWGAGSIEGRRRQASRTPPRAGRRGHLPRPPRAGRQGQGQRRPARGPFPARHPAKDHPGERTAGQPADAPGRWAAHPQPRRRAVRRSGGEHPDELRRPPPRAAGVAAAVRVPVDEGAPGAPADAQRAASQVAPHTRRLDLQPPPARPHEPRPCALRPPRLARPTRSGPLRPSTSEAALDRPPPHRRGWRRSRPGSSPEPRRSARSTPRRATACRAAGTRTREARRSPARAAARGPAGREPEWRSSRRCRTPGRDGTDSGRDR